MELRVNMWVDDYGEVVLSSWRVGLLRAVADEGSISGAATALDVPYRVAWRRIHEMEERLGAELVDARTGGQGGGGAGLTELGRALVDAFEAFEGRALPALEEAFDGTVRPHLP